MRNVFYILCYGLSGVLVYLDFSRTASLITSTFYIILAGIFLVLSSPVMLKVYVYLCLAPWYTIKKNVQHQEWEPLVSVIIPAYNEQVGLVDTIKTLLESTYKKLEIVVVNDGSTDKTHEIMQAFLSKYHRTIKLLSYVPIIYIPKMNAGKGAALNTGILASHGEICVCIDADCRVTKECIRQFVKSLQDPKIAAVCGNVKVGNPNSFLAQLQLLEYACSFYGRQADALLGSLYVISGAAGAFRRETLHRVGYYNENLHGGGEDADIGFKIQQEGMRVAFAPHAVIYTEVPTTLKGLTKQRIRWTRSRFELFRRYPYAFLNRKNIILNWITVPLTQFNDWFYLLRFVLRFVLYGFCLLTGNIHLLLTFILVTTVTCIFPLATNEKDYRGYVLLAPIYWLLSLVSTSVEAYAVASAIAGMLAGRQVQWQTWNRTGLQKK